MNKQRFYKLGFGLSVALQSNIPQSAEVEKFLKDGIDLSEVAYNKGKGQIFHPGMTILDDLNQQVVFSVVTNGQENFKKLVFFTKNRSIAARFGEEEPFGFDGTQPGASFRGWGHLTLAFPGVNGVFSPVYIKTKLRKSKVTLNLKIKAIENEKGQVVVSIRRTTNFPCHLYFK